MKMVDTVQRPWGKYGTRSVNLVTKGERLTLRHTGEKVTVLDVWGKCVRVEHGGLVVGIPASEIVESSRSPEAARASFALK